MKCKLWEKFNMNSKAIASAKKMDVADVAAGAGISRQSIYGYWSGRMAPGLERVELIANALKVDPLLLMSDPAIVDADDAAAGGTGLPKPEDMLSDNDRAALAIGREVMAMKDYELLLDVCRRVGTSQIRHIAALLIG